MCQSCTRLKTLDLRGNPVSKLKRYRRLVVLASPTLQVLDGKQILARERDFLMQLAIKTVSKANVKQRPEQELRPKEPQLPPSNFVGRKSQVPSSKSRSRKTDTSVVGITGSVSNLSIEGIRRSTSSTSSSFASRGKRRSATKRDSTQANATNHSLGLVGSELGLVSRKV